jgi:ectoine hydroxylase-related dioxygenase (phytanoyl-CoA dioxygenase family)
MNENLEKYISDFQRDGYCVLPQVYNAPEVKAALATVRELQIQCEGQVSDAVPYLNQNQPVIYNLQNKSLPLLQMLFNSPDIEKILVHFLNDVWYKAIPSGIPNYQIRSYMARSSAGALPLHLDSFVPYIGDFVYSMQTSIILEDMGPANGCTIVVPGTHQTGQYAEQDALKDAIPIEAKAGDVLIWDSRLWHGTTANSTSGTRWSLICTYSRWWLKQAFNIVQNLPQEIYRELSDKQKSVLGFCSVPYNHEGEGIDLKRGFESLQPDVSAYRRGFLEEQSRGTAAFNR